jgi:hypothetical protein
MISENTIRLAKLLSDASARDDILVYIDNDASKCCIHPGTSEVYAITCSKRMALHIVSKWRLRGEATKTGFLYTA